MTRTLPESREVKVSEIGDRGWTVAIVGDIDKNESFPLVLRHIDAFHSRLDGNAQFGAYCPPFVDVPKENDGSQDCTPPRDNFRSSLRRSLSGLTTAFTGAKLASEAPLVERPVQGMVRRHAPKQRVRCRDLNAIPIRLRGDFVGHGSRPNTGCDRGANAIRQANSLR